MLPWPLTLFKRSSARRARSDQALEVVTPIDPAELEGADLLAWAAAELDPLVFAVLHEVARQRREALVRSDLIRLPARHRRTGSWLQGWKILCTAAVSFQVTLVVEDTDSRALTLRMTAFPLLSLPPLENRALMNMVKRYTAVELIAALAGLDVGAVTTSGYGLREQRRRFPALPPVAA